ncbi:hypothetical protein EDD11_001809 [Mortierella claussenii]|nr:hypothetical protein EDD11_001809 [Mortierella claussenii]
MVKIEQMFEAAYASVHPNDPLPDDFKGEGLVPFMNLTREQCQILLALYHVVDPALEPKVPLLFPEMARKFREDRQERNSALSKLARAPEVYTEEVLNLLEVQKAVSMALINNDLDIDLAHKYLKMKPRDTPMEQLTVQEVLSYGILLAGVKNDPKDPQNADNDAASPLQAPNFREAKAYYDYAFDKFNFTMAAVQLGSFYLHEFKDCRGVNCQEGEDPEQISLEYYLKAAKAGNPMAMHKVAWHYDQKGQWYEAIPWYVKAADDGFPDAAHNLGMIYQEGNSKVTPQLEVDLNKAIEYYARGLQYGYGASGTQLGRLFFMLATNKEFRPKLPSTSQYYSNDPQEYFQTAISYFNQANHLVEVESMQFLGMIYGSKDFGRYNIDSAQNLFELAFMASNGGQQSFEYLCRVLSAKRAIIADQIAAEEASAGQSSSAPQKVDAAGLKTCAAKGCGKKETKKDQFQRCAGCKKRYFCSRLCQVNDWKEGHKKACKK